MTVNDVHNILRGSRSFRALAHDRAKCATRLVSVKFPDTIGGEDKHPIFRLQNELIDFRIRHAAVFLCASVANRPRESAAGLQTVRLPQPRRVATLVDLIAKINVKVVVHRLLSLELSDRHHFATHASTPCSLILTKEGLILG